MLDSVKQPLVGQTHHDEMSTSKRMKVGDRYGRLIVEELIPQARATGQKRTAICRCDCGRVVTLNRSNIRNGHTSSCGCLRKEMISVLQKKHGKRHSAEYKAWQGARQRCTNSGNNSFSRYGARGIKVCERWNSFENFLADIGPRPTPQHSLDRIDVNGDYCPENCRWATSDEQVANRRPMRANLPNAATEDLIWALRQKLSHPITVYPASYDNFIKAA